MSKRGQITSFFERDQPDEVVKKFHGTESSEENESESEKYMDYQSLESEDEDVTVR